MNPDRDSMVSVLLQYIEDNEKLSAPKTAASKPMLEGSGGGGGGGGLTGTFSPSPPGGSRSSRAANVKNFCGMKVSE